MRISIKYLSQNDVEFKGDNLCMQNIIFSSIFFVGLSILERSLHHSTNTETILYLFNVLDREIAHVHVELFFM